MENKNMELENQVIEVAVEEETKEKGLWTEVKTGAKKHWKGALLTAVSFVAGYILKSWIDKAGESEEADEADFESGDYTVEDI